MPRQGLSILSKTERTVLTITGLSHLAVHAQMLVFPALLPLFHKQFGLGFDTLGLMATAGAFMFGLGAIPAGLLESRLGGRKLLVIYQVGSGFAALIIVTAQTIFQITVGLAVLGAMSSIYHPAGLTILSHRLKHLSKGMSIHGIAGSIGLAVGPLLAGIFAEFGDWKFAFGIWMVWQFFLSGATILLIPNRSRASDSENVTSPNKTDIYSLALYYIISISMGFAFGGFTTYMPSLFASQTGSVFEYIPETLRGGCFTTLVFIGGIVGQTIGGVLGDKYNRAALLFFIVLINIPFFALMGYASGLFLIIVSLMLGIAHFSPQPISNALLAELTSIRQRGLGYGISFFLSFGIGGGIAPAVCGWIAEHYTISAIFPFMAISLLPAVISGPLLIKRFHHSSWNR